MGRWDKLKETRKRYRVWAGARDASDTRPDIPVDYLADSEADARAQAEATLKPVAMVKRIELLPEGSTDTYVVTLETPMPGMMMAREVESTSNETARQIVAAELVLGMDDGMGGMITGVSQSHLKTPEIEAKLHSSGEKLRRSLVDKLAGGKRDRFELPPLSDKAQIVH